MGGSLKIDSVSNKLIISSSFNENILMNNKFAIWMKFLISTMFSFKLYQNFDPVKN